MKIGIKIRKAVLLVFCFLAFTGFSQTKYTGLKAIFIVGPQEDGTTEAIKKMNELVRLFTLHGIQTVTFYNKKTDWEAIKTASKGANFLVYSGHGTTLGEGGKTGGLCLNSMISTKEIQEGLQLAPNSLILFQSVCMGAGSSAGDDDDIGILEAETRVSDYSNIFLKTGSGAYYANNYIGGCLNFMKQFFEGKTLEEAFNENLYSNQKVDLKSKFKYNEAKMIYIASDESSGTVTRTTYTNGVKKVEEIPSIKDYDAAFVGDPNFSMATVSGKSEKKKK